MYLKGARGSSGGTELSKLNLGALDVFNHAARTAQDIAATMNSATAKPAIEGEDLTVDQLTTQPSSHSQITTVNPALMASANEEEKHFVGFEYADQNGDKVNDVQFEVNFDGGSKVKGTMYGGFHRLDGVPDEGFNLEFVPSEPIEQELNVLRKELRTALDQSLAQVKSESKIMSKTWEETAAWIKPFIYVGGAMTGVGQWIADSVEGVADMAVGIVKARAATDQWLREYALHRQKAFGYFVSGNDEGFQQEMKHIEAMHTELGEDISDVAESVRILSLIALDTETRTMLHAFPADYFSELHSTEKVRVGMRYGVDIILVLAAGIGAGLLAIKNAGKISRILSRIAKLIEKLRLNLKARKGKVDETFFFKAPHKKGKFYRTNADGSTGYIDPNALKKINDPARKPVLTSDGTKVIPLGKTQADAITIRNKRNLDADGYLTKGDKKLKYDEDGFPVFNSKFDTVIDDSHLGSGKDKIHFKAANENLAKELKKNPELAKDLGLTDKQVEFILKEPPEKTAPNGLTWHHHQDTGRMQLIDSKTHDDFKHTGGMSIWGGGY